MYQAIHELKNQGITEEAISKIVNVVDNDWARKEYGLNDIEAEIREERVFVFAGPRDWSFRLNGESTGSGMCLSGGLHFRTGSLGG